MTFQFGRLATCHYNLQRQQMNPAEMAAGIVAATAASDKTPKKRFVFIIVSFGSGSKGGSVKFHEKSKGIYTLSISWIHTQSIFNIFFGKVLICESVTCIECPIVQS